MSVVAAERMASRLTVPFERGADTFELRFSAGATATAANIAGYNFNEHIARFSRYGLPPDARYIFTARGDVVVPTRLDVGFEVVPPGTPAVGTVTLDVPAGTHAGMSFALGLAANEGPFTRLRTVTSAPASAPGTVAEAWSVVALLGNFAKLLWAAGWEKDALRAYFDEVRSQNVLRQAVSTTLDLFGYDLGVQRFPPLPYAFEAGTVALYHLDELPAPPATEVAQVENVIERYGGRPHPGTNVVTGGRPRAQSGAAGRFGSGFLFRDNAAQITIPNDTDFAVAAADDFTAECFVNPDNVATTGHILTKHPDPGTTNAAGWALSIGDFGRGITRNVRFLVGDGAAGVPLFLDETLAPARFYHLAGVIDRAAGEARLYVDGRVRASASITAIGDLTNAEPVRISLTGNDAFKGVIDEVRLSGASRSAFHPVLGESDESYRRRLLVFARWMLPARPTLLAALNEVAGPIGNDPEPFVIEERNAPLNGGRVTLTIFPTEVGANRHIAADGDRHVLEPPVNGTPEGEVQFDPLFLVEHTGAVYATAPSRDLKPGELPPNPRRMQLATARAVDRLLALSGPTLRVESAFDPRADDLRAVGRALHLTHDALPLRDLAALAHRAGFSWVLHDARAGHVYASVAPADYVEIAVTAGTPTTTTGFDLLVGEQIELTAQPPLVAAQLYNWSMIACGAGRGKFTTDRGAATATLEATAPGDLAVQIEVTLGQRLFTTTRTFRVGLAQLADGESIEASGRLGVSEDVAGSPADEVLQPTVLLAPYLVTFDDVRATYGGSLDNRRMQPAVADALRRLLDLIGVPVGGGTLHVAKTIASATGLEPVGRSLTLDHFSVPVGELGALCHAAGFTYVRRQGNDVLVLQRAGDLVGIDTTPPATTQLAEGSSVRLSVRPRAGPSSLAVSGSAAFVANSGTDVVTQLDVATGRVQALFKVGWEPVGVAAAPTANTMVYTADRAGGTVTAIDLAAGTVHGSFDVGARPVALAHHPTADRLIVALENGDLADVDTGGTPLAVTRTVALGAQPLAVVLTPNGGEAWVALANDNIAVVDTATFAAPALVALPATPQDLALDAARAYVTLPATPAIVIVDVAARTVGAPIAVGASPGPIALAPDGSKVYVADTADARLYLREPNGDPDRRFPVGRLAVDVVAAPDRVYVVTRSTPGAMTVGADGVTVVDASDADVVAGWTLGTGLGETLIWSMTPAAPTEASLSSTTASEVELTAELAGPVHVRAVYVAERLPPPSPRTTAPYTFEVRLKDKLQHDANVVIRKEQYDLVMNVLNAFHPVGVEVITQAIREKVIEVREGLMEVFPAYTFPEFRVRGPNPALELRATRNGDSRKE